MNPVVVNFEDGFNVFIDSIRLIRETFYINFAGIELPITDLFIAFMLISIIFDLFNKGE